MVFTLTERHETLKFCCEKMHSIGVFGVNRF